MRRLLLTAVLASACASGSTTSSPSASAPISATQSVAVPSATTSPRVPVAAFRADPAATWPAYLYEASADGSLRRRTEAGATFLATPCTQVLRMRVHVLGVLVWCRTTTPDREELKLVGFDGKVRTILANVLQSWPADLSLDGKEAVAFRFGTCQPSAPVCETRAVIANVATGAERELLPGGYHLGATLQYTVLGLTLYQPMCAEAGCTTADRAGTFVWDGTAFKRFSDMRFVAVGGPELYERSRSLSDRSADRVAVTKFGSTLTTLTPAGAREIPLTITSNGEALVYRMAAPFGPEGPMLVRYDQSGAAVWSAEVAGELPLMPTPNVVQTLAANTVFLYDLRRMLSVTIQTAGPTAVGER